MDFTTDNNPVGLYRALDIVDVPDYVGTAPLMKPEDVSRLHKSAFADSKHREFPCHTKTAAWLSAAYFFGSNLENEPVGERIKSACAVHGIDIAPFVALNEQVKSASAEIEPDIETHALTVDFGGEDGRGVEKYYPIKIASQVQDSSRALLNDYDAGKMPDDWFVRAAQSIVKAASATGLAADALHDRIKQAGVHRLFSLESALRMADARAWAGVPAESVELYKQAAQGAAQDPGNELQWMSLWDDLDRANHVKYSKLVPRPHAAFFAGPEVEQIEKLASEVVILEDVMIPKAVIAKPSEQSLRQRFTKQAAEKILEIQKVACQNPYDASRQFAELDGDTRKEFLKVLLNA